LIQALPRSQFDGIDLQVGMRIKASNKENNEVEMLSVVKIDEDEVTVDANHPLAGQILHFTIAIVDVREPTASELEQGYALSTNPPAN